MIIPEQHRAALEIVRRLILLGRSAAQTGEAHERIAKLLDETEEAGGARSRRGRAAPLTTASPKRAI